MRKNAKFPHFACLFEIVFVSLWWIWSKMCIETHFGVALKCVLRIN